MRFSRLSLVAVICFSTLASADLKIKTRTTVMGHTTENTVYIKGARQRTEMNFGGHGGTASIIQCDQKRMVTVMPNQCMVMPFGDAETSCPATPNMREMMKGKSEAAPPRAGGVEGRAEGLSEITNHDVPGSGKGSAQRRLSADSGADHRRVRRPSG